jgi:hypothetical protein
MLKQIFRKINEILTRRCEQAGEIPLRGKQISEMLTLDSEILAPSIKYIS